MKEEVLVLKEIREALDGVLALIEAALEVIDQGDEEELSGAG